MDPCASFLEVYKLPGQIWRFSYEGRKRATALTRWSDPVLPGGLVVAEGEQHGLDGADEDPGQTAVEDHVEQRDLDCGGDRNTDRIRAALHGE